MTTSGQAPLEVNEDHDARGPRLRVVGEIDLSSLPVLDEAIQRVLAGTPAWVGFDLAGVRFIDSSGIAELLQVAGTVPGIALIDPSPAVRRLIEFSGLGDVLPMTTGTPGP